MVNCCAAYQALLHQRREEREKDPFSANKEDQLDIDMDRLSAAVQAVDGMLDEIDRLLKVLLIIKNLLYLLMIIYYTNIHILVKC